MLIVGLGMSRKQVAWERGESASSCFILSGRRVWSLSHPDRFPADLRRIRQITVIYLKWGGFDTMTDGEALLGQIWKVTCHTFGCFDWLSVCSVASGLQVGAAAQRAQETQDPVTELHFLTSNVFRNTLWAAVLLRLFVTRLPCIPQPQLYVQVWMLWPDVGNVLLIWLVAGPSRGTRLIGLCELVMWCQALTEFKKLLWWRCTQWHSFLSCNRESCSHRALQTTWLISGRGATNHKITRARHEAGMRRTRFAANKTRRGKGRMSERLRRQRGLFLRWKSKIASSYWGSQRTKQ